LSRTIGLESTRDGPWCLHFNVLGPAPLGPGVSHSMTLHQANDALDRVLREAGCLQYSSQEARSDASEVWRDVRQDALDHGEAADRAFFTFVVVENVGIFTFFERSVGIFVVPGQEANFRSHFDRLAMIEVERAKRVLAQHFRKPAPDLIIDPPLSNAWLDSSTNVDPS